MAYEFKCPHYNRSEYSAYDHEDQEKIRCIYCTKEYDNPHYEKKEGKRP